MKSKMTNFEQPISLTIDQALQQAITHHRQGQLQDAERLYRAILQSHPCHPDANHNLGVLAVQVKQPSAGLSHFKAAVEVNSNQEQYWYSYIDALIQAGQADAARLVLQQGRQQGLHGEMAEALAVRLEVAVQTAEQTNAEYQQAHKHSLIDLQAVPQSNQTSPTPQEVSTLAATFAEGRYAEAIILAQKMTLRFPQHGFGWKALGVLFKLQGRTEESLEPMQKAAALLSGDAEVHCNLGATLNDLGLREEAEASYRRALEIKPDYAKAHFNLGNTLKLLGRLEEAEASYRNALEIKPDYAEAYSNLGNILREFGRLVEAEAGYRRALEIKPDHAKAHINLGVTHQEMGRLEEAEAGYRRALEIKPDYAEAYSNLGITLIDLGRLEEAEACCRRALEIKPNYAEAHSNLLFILNYSACSYFPDHFEEACSWEARSLSEATRAAARERQFSRSPLTGRRLRVGYVSSDFRKHAVSYFVEQLFAHHDAARVEVFAYSNNNKRDVVTERIKSLVEHWVPVAGLSDQKLLARIEADQIDLLIDLSGHTANNRLGLFALRAAPVQAHWLGYFASTGLTEMDYWIGDATLTPTETDHHFKETVWRLPRIWVSYEGKAEAPDSHWQPAQDGTVCLGSFNNLGKLTPATLALWTQLLHNLPKAKLLLKTQELAEERNRQRILDAFTSYGIGHERIELQDRSITADWSAHMAYYDRLDIALDPVGAVGGGTTTCDALWMGVPVVSLVGDRMASRMTASMLDALGRSEWLATSEDEYVAKVMALAHDIEGRKAMRANQRARMASSPLCDAKGLAQTLEDAFEKMFERWWVQTKKMN